MAIHKLADGPLTITVADVEEAEGNFGPQLKFSDAHGTSVFVNVAPAQRQLARLSLDTETVIGHTIHLEQVKKNGTTFTNINLAAGGDGVAPAPRAASAAPARSPAAAPAAPKMTVADLAPIYMDCVNTAFMTLGMKCEEAGVTITAEALQAAAATLFIKATR